MRSLCAALGRLIIGFLPMFIVLTSEVSARAQVYTLEPSAPAKPKAGTAQKQSRPSSAAAQQPVVQQESPSLGFGSNLQTARLAHAAESALARGDNAAAMEFAQQAADGDAGNPHMWFLLGYAARLDYKFALSERAYDRGIHLNPSELDGISGLAQTYSEVGRFVEAERLLKQILASNSNRPGDSQLLGSLYLQAGDDENAILWLRRAETLQSGARTELLLAVAYQNQKQMNLAEHFLSLARQRSPDDPDVQRALAGYYRQTGDYAQAIAALKLIRDPRPDVTAELAFTEQLAGQWGESASLYAQVAQARPKDLGLQLSAAQAQVAAGAPEQATPFLERAQALDDGYYRLHAIRGEIARMSGRNEDALREFSAALARAPDTPPEGPLYTIQLHVDLMQLYQSLHDRGAAERELRTAQLAIDAMDERGAGRPQFLRLRALIRMNAHELAAALSDIQEAVALAPHDVNNLLLNGDVLTQSGRLADAIVLYQRALAVDPRNRFALTSSGYVSRATGHDADAEKFFQTLARDYPALDVPWLALGDLYTTRGQFTKAQAAYDRAYPLSRGNALIVAGGMNAAIEAHNFDLAGTWLGRATSAMTQEPQFLLEKERYYSFTKDYRRSAEVGRQTIALLPEDRDAVVYLGYDLLYLEQYDELLQLTDRYSRILPREADIPLLAGYVHKRQGDREQALRDFTEVLTRDANVVTAYVNRGYVLNDMHRPSAAAADFESALKREPKNGEAHLGLAYADLDLGKPRAAVTQTQLAQKVMGDSEVLHTIRATAYGRQGLLARAILEYRAALRFTPDDGSLHYGIGNILYAERRYHEAIAELQLAEKLSPHNPAVYALLARAFANLDQRDQALSYVHLAEQRAKEFPPKVDSPGSDSAIFVATGQALSSLGDDAGAMSRFQEALAATDSNRFDVRLAIAQLMAQQDHVADAERQISLGLLEAEAGETLPPTGNQYIAAADVLRQTHEYQLSQDYLHRAKAAGAADISVRVGLANNYLALGDTTRASAELAAVSNIDSSEPDYEYLLAEASVYQQQHQGAQALTAFAQAASAAGEDQTAEQGLLQAGANEGYRINKKVSALSDLEVEPIFEDSTVYVLDSKLDALTPVPSSNVSLLPPPRSSVATQWTNAFHLHLDGVPTIGGFFQLRNARGDISVPATDSIVDRDTYDYAFNVGVAPATHLGGTVVQFNSGVQATVRRDSLSPVELNQNLFRVFTYISTGSFFNAVSVDGYVVRETGPFTESNIHSSSLAGAVNFRVGEPWGKTALVTGWGANEQKFNPVATENYYTASYIGLSRRFSERFQAEAVVEDLRAWRTRGSQSGIAQVLRPVGTFAFALNRHWAFDASTAWSSTRGFHVYDAVQGGLSVSYATSLSRSFNDETGQIQLRYPVRFSAGLQQEKFYNFTIGPSEQLRPYVSITLF